MPHRLARVGPRGLCVAGTLAPPQGARKRLPEPPEHNRQPMVMLVNEWLRSEATFAIEERLRAIHRMTSESVVADTLA